MSNNKMQSQEFLIKKDDAGLPIDKVILKHSPEMSRRRIRRILDMGGIKVNSKKVKIASFKVKVNDQVLMTYSETSVKAWTQHKFILTKSDILYYSDDLVMINKPPLLASQAVKSKFASHAESVVKEYYLKNNISHNKVLLCHRLDKETSGILVLAHNDAAADWIMKQFKDKVVAKTYLALCYGIPKEKSWSIENHLSSINKKTGKVSKVNSGGKFASTSFKLIETFPKFKLSLIECSPKTGRSHQIRVHLETYGTPIVGDKKYGLEKVFPLPKKMNELILSHHFLHAFKIELLSLDQKKISLKSSLPDNFRKILIQLNSVGINGIQ